jgi:two-component system sensor kinase
MAAESYVGCTLWSSKGQPIGLIAVISRKHLANPRPAESILKLVAMRAAGELERRQAEMALKAHQLQLEAANKELESFSYSVSHDLRAPLRAIDGFSRIILKQQWDKFDENTRRQFNLIRDNTKMMEILIDNLLTFSRVISNNMTVSEINMDKLATEVWKELWAANQKRKLEVKITDIMPGFGDRTLIKQVLLNLFSNAVKFTKNQKPGIIEMSSYKEGDKIVYSLKDNGAGFDMEYYDKLFGVFQRLHSNEEYEGTGVGLAIVQRIIHRHGSRVWGEAKVDEGATFYFTLPAG